MKRPSLPSVARTRWRAPLSAVLLGASTGCSLWNGPVEEAPGAEASAAPSAEAAEPERGGSGLLDPEGVDVVEFVGMDHGGGSTILIYTAGFTDLGTYDPQPAPEEVSAGLTLTFEGLPEASLLRYELLSENIHVRDSQREPDEIAAERCVDAGEAARVRSQTDGAPCDPDWG